MIRGIFIIVFSFIVAFALTIIPLPIELNWARPMWVVLLVIFWSIYAPKYVGILAAWCVGILLDVFQGTMLCSQALGLVTIAYLTSVFYTKLRLARLPQQTLMVLLLLLVYQGWIVLLQGMIGAIDQINWEWAMAPATSCLMWPFSTMLQRRIYLYYDTAR